MVNKQNIDFQKISDFNKFVDKQCKPTSKMLTGFFYTYVYDYRMNPDIEYQVPRYLLEMYDSRPVAFIYDVHITQDNVPYLRGINFHFMPPKAREYVINTIWKMNKSNIESNNRIIMPSNIVTQLMAKLPFAMRMYDPIKIKHLKKIEYGDVKYIMKFIPDTHDWVKPFTIFERYRNYKPRS